MRRDVAHQKLRLAQQRLMLALLPLWTKLTELAGAIAEGVAKLTYAFNKLNPGLQSLIAGTIAWFAGSKLINAFLSNKLVKTLLKLTGLSGKFKVNLKDIGKFIPKIGIALRGLVGVIFRILAPLYALYHCRN